jgi:hypothetical protein
VTTLEDAAALAHGERGLVVVSTLRADGTIQSSLVNAGVLAHPATSETVLGFVTAGPVKLANLRARPQVTATFGDGWQWAAVEGPPSSPDRTTPSHGWPRRPPVTASGHLLCGGRRARRLGHL